MKNTHLIILILILNCNITRESLNKRNEEALKNPERVDCNFYWPTRKIHVCIQNMLREDCEFLFSQDQFIKEADCYCLKYGKTKNMVHTLGYIQYDCK